MGEGIIGVILGVVIAAWFFLRYIKRDRTSPPRDRL